MTATCNTTPKIVGPYDDRSIDVEELWDVARNKVPACLAELRRRR